MDYTTSLNEIGFDYERTLGPTTPLCNPSSRIRD
jgi:hypothetical protein